MLNNKKTSTKSKYVKDQRFDRLARGEALSNFHVSFLHTFLRGTSKNE